MSSAVDGTNYNFQRSLDDLQECEAQDPPNNGEKNPANVLTRGEFLGDVCGAASDRTGVQERHDALGCIYGPYMLLHKHAFNCMPH
jgi:hypothetical protein